MRKNHLENLVKQVPGISLLGSNLVGLGWGPRMSSQRMLTLTSMDHIPIYMTCPLLNFQTHLYLGHLNLFFFPLVCSNISISGLFLCLHPLSIDSPLYTPRLFFVIQFLFIGHLLKAHIQCLFLTVHN